MANDLQKRARRQHKRQQKRARRAVEKMSHQTAQRIAAGEPSDIAIASEDTLDEEQAEKLRELVHQLCQARSAAGVSHKG